MYSFLEIFFFGGEGCPIGEYFVNITLFSYISKMLRENCMLIVIFFPVDSQVETS